MFALILKKLFSFNFQASNQSLNIQITCVYRASESKTKREAFKKIAKKLNNKFKPKIIMEIGIVMMVFFKKFY